MPVQDNLPAAVTDALAAYKVITSLPVQWGDMDAFGHVNNVVYIRWLESARTDLMTAFESDVTMTPGGYGPILASIRCDYKQQLRFPDTVHIGSRIGRIGKSSVDVEHAVYSEGVGKMAATGVSALVIFDYQNNRPVRIPPALLAQLQSPTDA